MMVFSGSANPPLTEDVCEILGTEPGPVRRSVFPNGEIYIRFQESVRGAHCFVIQSHSQPVNFHVMEQLIMIDALRRASARRITAVMPFYAYARQDKKGMPREPITARLIGDLYLAAGADRIVSVDLHTGQVQGFIPKPFDHLTALPIFRDYLRRSLEGPVTVVSPDSGRVKLASKYARHLDATVAFVHKRRAPGGPNQAAALEIVGDVRGRHCVIVDDMVDTASTAVSAAELLKERGANLVSFMATHGVFSPPAVDRLKNAPIEDIVVTNTLPIGEDAAALDNLTILSIAPLVADAIEAIFKDRSVSALFMGENA